MCLCVCVCIWQVWVARNFWKTHHLIRDSLEACYAFISERYQWRGKRCDRRKVPCWILEQMLFAILIPKGTGVGVKVIISYPSFDELHQG